MTDTPDDLLLLEAEHLARDLVLEADHSRQAAATLLNGWAPAIQAGADCLAQESTNPLSQVPEIWHGMRRDAHEGLIRGSPASSSCSTTSGRDHPESRSRPISGRAYCTPAT